MNQGDTIESLAAALASGALTSVALLERLLERIAKADPCLHAFSNVLAEHARQQARALDAERARGVVRGPLHGIPVALKDVFDVARQPTTGGSRLYAGNFAREDAAIVRRLIDAGAVILGKTHQVELCFGGWGTNAALGTPRNPWDLARHRAPGGSSSGAAVAVAAGLAPAAIGTDTGGSVRIPAALCGVVGLKTTAGSLAREGCMLLSQSLDSIGPLARTVADVAILHEVLSGQPPEPTPARPRIGILTARDIDAVDNDVLAAYDDAVGWLGDLGAALAEFSFGEDLDSYVERMGVIIGHEGWQAHGLRILQSATGMDPHVRSRFLAGQRVSPLRYATVQRDRALAASAARETFTRFDAVLTPTTPIAAPPLEAVDETALPLSRYTRVVNYLGLCALALPAGLDADGLPVSVQLVGPPASEPLLIALGRELEARRGPFPRPGLAALGLP